MSGLKPLRLTAVLGLTCAAFVAAATPFFSQIKIGGTVRGSGEPRGSINTHYVATNHLPQTDGAMCPVSPTAAATTLLAALRQSQREDSGGASFSKGAVEPRPSDAARLEASKRPPIHVMRDPNPAFSAVAVDLAHDEVVMADENNFSIVAYNRLENTPPKAKMSEPKRMIAGMQAYLEFNCAVYVDPANGDIYSVNNDTLDWMTVFNRDVKGDMPPTRKLRAPHTVFGIAVDEEKQEILLAEQDDHAVVVFKKSAKDEDSPVRVLQGSKTHLADPHGIAIDPKAELIFVTNWGSVNERPELGDPRLKPIAFGKVTRTLWPVTRDYTVPSSGKLLPPSITVYPKDAGGNTPPLRIIEGDKTGMNWPTAIAADPDHGELFVANDTADSITVYKSDANGDVSPIRVIRGPKSLVKNPTGVAYDAKHEELWVTNFGNHSATVYKRTADGDVAPIRIIRSAPLSDPAPMMGNPHTITFDTKREEILVSNCVAHPQIAAFSRLAEGGAKAVRSIAGQHTLVTRTIHDMAYDPVRDEIIVPNFFAFSLVTFKGDATGDAAPIRNIFGSQTQLKLPERLALDAVHGEIFVPQGKSILVFSRDADGDVPPIRILKGPDTMLGASAITVDPVHNLLIVSGSGGGEGAEEGEGGGASRGGHILIFDRTASGNTKPLRTITGPGVTGATLMTTIPSRGYIVASVRKGGRSSDLGYVGVWSIYDDGAAPPRWTIGGPGGMLRDVRGVTIDANHKNVIVSDKYVNGVLTYNFPEIF